MSFSTYPFAIDRDAGTVIFSYDYFVPAYSDPETFEYFDQTFWSLIVTEIGVSSGGMSGYAGESANIWLDFGLTGGNAIRRFHLDFQAFNTFSAESVADSWTLTAAAYADIPLLMTGGAGYDLMLGGLSGDTLQGESGNDVLDGGDGADTLEGGDGSDLMDGGAGDDMSVGGAGDDIHIVRSAGDVVVEAMDGGGDAVLATVTHTLAAHVEYLGLLGTANLNGTGNGGDNVIMGNSGRNILRGANGDDGLNGAEGDDTLRGADGDDTLTGGAGRDILEGGAGDDFYVIDSLDVLIETNDPLSGVDMVVTAPDMASYTLLENFEILMTWGNAAFNGRGNTQANEIIGGIAADLLQGFGGADVLFGGLGNDRLEGGADVDELWGGSGQDTAVYSASGAAVQVDLAAGAQAGGEAQGDMLFDVEDVVGSRFADTLTGSVADNRLVGGAGDDDITGGAGNDRLIGGAGADQLDGGVGNDMLDYSSSSGGVSINLALNTAAGGHAAGDVIVDFEHVTGSDNDDTLRGDARANQLRGLGGSDQIFGGGGDDTIIGGAGADLLDGEGGVNRVSYSDSVAGVVVDLASMLVSGGDAEGDQIFHFDNADGGRGADRLYGHEGANRLGGGIGADELYGRGGADVLQGGAGADLLDGGDGADTASYAGATGSVVVSLEAGVGTFGEAAGDTYASIENVEGGAANDYIVGDAGANRISGREGFDYLDGREGNDALTGGAGGDVFRFHTGFDRDVITDFTQGEDLIFIDFDGAIQQFDHVMSMASAAGPGGQHTRFDFGNGDVLVIYNVQLASFTADDFSFLV